MLSSNFCFFSKWFTNCCSEQALGCRKWYSAFQTRNCNSMETYWSDLSFLFNLRAKYPFSFFVHALLKTLVFYLQNDLPIISFIREGRALASLNQNLQLVPAWSNYSSEWDSGVGLNFATWSPHKNALFVATIAPTIPTLCKTDCIKKRQL